MPDLAPHLTLGASPRATLGLIAAGRALALLRGRRYLLPQDVFDVAPEVLRHRLILSYDALAANVTTDDLIRRLLSTITAPRVAPAAGHGGHAAAAPSMPASVPAVSAARRPA